MSRVFSKKFGGYLDEFFDFIGDKFEDINHYFKDIKNFLVQHLLKKLMN